MSKPFILIDNTMTMHGIRFAVEGGRWERFKKNPVMLYMHTRGEVIGKWNDVRLENGAWIADPEFDMEDPAAAKIARKVNKGFINASSPGVAIHEAAMINGEPVAIDWEPYETSIVDSGSNPNALQLYTSEGEKVADPESYIKNLTLSIMSKETKTGTELAETITKEVLPKTIALAAGLGETATTEEVTTKILAILTENKDLKLAAESNEKTRVKDLVDAAFAAKKISDSDKDHYMKLGTLDFEATKAILGSIQAPVNLAQFAASGEPATTSEQDSAEYEKLFKENKLVQLKAENPTKFKRLFKATFGTEPED
jgi:hypothetical protein